MKKIAVYVFVMWGGFLNLQAQGFDSGFKLGGNLNTLNVSDFQNQIDFSDFNGTASKFSYHFGAFSKFEIWRIRLQGEALFTRIESVMMGEVNGQPAEMSFKMNRLDFPVGLHIKLPFVRVGGGIGWAVNLNQPNPLSFSDYKFDTTYWFLELGRDLGPLYLSARFEFPDAAVPGFIQNPSTNVPVSANTTLQLFRISAALTL